MRRKEIIGPQAALLFSGATGIILALQSHFNGALGVTLENPYLAGFLSCSLGLVILIGIHFSSVASKTALRELPQLVRSARLPWWALTGGCFGAFLVFAQSLAIGILGVALFSVGTVVGQVIGGICIDRIGLGSAEHIGVSFRRAIGAVLAVLAIVVTGFGVLGDSGAPWILIAPIIAGAGTGWQAAANGVMRQSINNVVAVTLINFSIGWTILLVATAISIAVQGFPTQWATNPVAYLGGVLGMLYVGVTALLVRVNGALVLGLSILAGQLLAAVLIDGLAPDGPDPTLQVLIGVGLALAAVAISSRVSARDAK